MDFGPEIDENDEDDQLFVKEGEEAVEHIPTLSIGDEVLWRTPNSSKEQFTFKAGRIVECYGREGYLVRLSDSCKPERVLNGRHLIKREHTNPRMDVPQPEEAQDQPDPEYEEEFHDVVEIPEGRTAGLLSPHITVSEQEQMSGTTGSLRRGTRNHRAPNRYGFED